MRLSSSEKMSHQPTLVRHGEHGKQGQHDQGNVAGKVDALAEEEEEGHQDGSGAESQEGEDPPGEVGDRGGVVVREDCDDGVTQPERGVQEDEDQRCSDCFWEVFHWANPMWSNRFRAKHTRSYVAAAR